ncbi:MAG: hypothetical protein A2667_00610 [Candidatus Wildermuthbacteria bacterium RIFCSPHIGHO2_01_FULL_47_27]|uniref:Uncharacterized protein n=2 Tax=Candidatus Wildermuthiibacteriota TaxID=1817923 RepID=A0A1G2RTE1_9BACT|nr:MAG: hypothetical protein UY15_C0034G0004 [Parcubacteria group bacterium GW2011_GWA2_47_9]OHA63265.1 MAG: hypothetical protein A2667_00610 [Candidatus Wildermuthbacteria bacterium RIFCSPHIGHO2_01_FULL_47_27]OHA67640.1 MAG: hypothetical protein A3D59_03685 [Candidatus Wildermuthbacteria bacterium RIFCSPHIGHO2_02_FULL_47_17]OHA75728.1 MAG: hypothetical protein A3A32_04040 [Candidatus Wildermuthbacteria bacterium RIFCSPLOWO2_01_FULL_48_35]
MFPDIIIALIIWFVSLFGIAAFVYKKRAVLRLLPERQSGGAKKEAQASKNWRALFLSPRIFSAFSPERILHKALLRAHVTILKAENKTASLLDRMRRKSESKINSSLPERRAHYWESLKKRPKN